MVKVKNNAGKVIEVTKVAWETLYKDREGFSLHTVKRQTKKPATTTKKSPAKKQGDK